MKRYQLLVRGGLFFTRGAIRHEGAICVVTLLIDTGSNYTIISWDALASLGLDPAIGEVRRSIMTANGLIQAPEVRIDDFHCLGKRVKEFRVVAHTIPFGGKVSGVLGMNFLRQHAGNLDFTSATTGV